MSYSSERNEENKLSLTAAFSTPLTGRKRLPGVSPGTALSDQKRHAVLPCLSSMSGRLTQTVLDVVKDKVEFVTSTAATNSLEGGGDDQSPPCSPRTKEAKRTFLTP